MSDCIPYSGQDKYRYPRSWDARTQRQRPAHVIAYQDFHDVEVPSGIDVHHRCRNTRCVNPEHLELVDHKAHRRLHAPKLTPAQVAAIRREYRELKEPRITAIGQPSQRAWPGAVTALGQKYGISRTMVRKIAVGKAWA